MRPRFADRVALITGGAGGIGRAVAARLHGEGASVVIADLSEAAAREAAASLSDRAAGVTCDVADQASIAAAMAMCMETFKRIDIVVNNAGLMTFKPIVDLSASDWLTVLQVDLIGAALFTTQAFRNMGPDGGAIVNVASIHAIRTSPLAAPYAAAKAGLLSLTRTAAIEGRPRRIRVNAILPGAIDTAMLWSNPNIASGAEVIEKSDVGAPEDIAAAVAFLASDDANFITGTALAVDGGRLAKL
jgi:NAD(P)-dependent dehydrogenase (short-subunit alcohol dehydrogenase family)